jgi:hypothetical protein
MNGRFGDGGDDNVFFDVTSDAAIVGPNAIFDCPEMMIYYLML